MVKVVEGGQCAATRARFSPGVRTGLHVVAAEATDTPRPISCTRITHCLAPINRQPPCCGARPSGIMSKAEEVTIIPFKAADHSQGRSRVLDRGYANFRELRKGEVRRI